jgi:glycosyltransferase involved in cell wall biosynthesis
VLYPPLWSPESYRCDTYGDYVFAPGRRGGAKRQELLIEAMEHVQTDVRLIVAGPPESDDDLQRLERRASRIRDRVTIIGRWISDAEKHDLFADALACAYVPYDEDSYGYVTLEACQCRKPTVTCEDAGGVLSLVIDGETGYVTAPDPKAIAQAFDELRSDVRRSRDLGENAFGKMTELDISWDRVVRSLLA